MSFNATKLLEGTSVAVCLVLTNEEKAPVRYTRFEVEVLKMKVDPNPELDFTCQLAERRADLELADYCSGAGDELRITVRNAGWGPAEHLEFTVNDPVLDQLVALEQRKFQGTVPSGGQTDWLLPARALNTEAFVRVQAGEQEQARQRMEEGMLREEFVNARYYLDPTISEAQKKQHREERAARARRDWENSYRVGLDQGFLPADARAHKPDLPIVPLRGLQALWRCRDASGRGHGNITKLIIGKGKPYSDELAIGPSVFVLLADSRRYTFSDPTPNLGVLLDLELGLHKRSFPIDIGLEAGARREFGLLLGTTKSAEVQVKLQLWREGGQWPELFHMDLWFTCPMGTPAAVVDGEKLKQGGGEVSPLDRFRLRELNLDRRYQTFPLIQNDPR